MIKNLLEKLKRKRKEESEDDLLEGLELEEKEKEEGEEELKLEENKEVIPLEEEKKEEVRDDNISKIMEKMTEFDNQIVNLSSSITSIKKDIDEIRNEIGKINDTLKDITLLYEVVSQQINPFVGYSKLTALSIQKIESLEEDIKKLKDEIDNLKTDLYLLLPRRIDVDKIITKILEGE